jgi:RNase P/RNase MRP subunit p30
MYTLYRLNADELSVEFLESLKTLFRHKTIEIAVCEAEAVEQDETAYLLANPANRARLLEAIENVRQQRNLVTVDLADLQ